MGEAVKTTCPYCGVGCGVLATPGSITGDPGHPANFGRLCVKGAALAETIGLEGRLLHPMVGGRQSDWDTALATIAERFGRLAPDEIAFYVSGQLLTEDYYVANKLMKGFLGGANIDTNSRLCMSSTVAGHIRAFGSDTVPGCYEDIEQAELVVLVGSNAAWCHPVLFQRIKGRVVVIDPRRTATCEAADLHLALRPGSDVALFSGLLAHVPVDEAYVAAHTRGFAEALAAARTVDVAGLTGLAPEQLAGFYEMFAGTEKVVTLFSQGVNQSTSGTDKVNAIVNVHLATGRIGRPGMGPFSLTGQPNAMGGREVGGLANQLAAHMGFSQGEVDRVRRFWGAPNVAKRPGLKAIEMFDAVRRGRIKALWIMATNPAVSLPDSGAVREALGACDFVVVSDVVADTDTARFADVLLPALAWGEKDGTVTNSERRISRQRAFLPPPGEARPDWWALAQVARRLGHGAAFAFDGPADIFAEHARLSAFENAGTRDFDIGALAEADYDTLYPVQWGGARPFGDGRFFTPDGRARFAAVSPRAPAAPVGEAYPLVLLTGRMRDQWHTMTRSGRSPRLWQHAPEPTLTLHPATAARLGLQEGGLARVESAHGAVLLRAGLDGGLAPGQAFAPIHWSDAFAADAVVCGLIGAACDPLSGQPELKHTPVRVTPLATVWHAVVLARTPVAQPSCLWWSLSRGPGHVQYRLEGAVIPDWRGWARRSFPGGEWIEVSDRRRGLYRAALVADGVLQAAVLAVADGEIGPRQWLAECFTLPRLSDEDRRGLLAGGSAGAGPQGRTVCVCFGVTAEAIRDAILTQGLADVEGIRLALGAGRNCGSCVPEIRALLAEGG
jgi:assimilatory nitrate reductase catalytic subunit